MRNMEHWRHTWEKQHGTVVRHYTMPLTTTSLCPLQTPRPLTDPSAPYRPLCRFHGVFPVLQRELDTHLLNESRQEPGKRDDGLVDELEGTAVVASCLEVPCLPKQCVNFLCALLSEDTDKT